jgi:hypothetical protein
MHTKFCFETVEERNSSPEVTVDGKIAQALNGC